MSEYKITWQGGRSELIEKKSRFIATVSIANSETEALAFIASIKKEYSDANHNCFAFVIGENHELQRCSDDGEPSGTAGRPMLDVLLGEGIHNTVVVVTRYFGGTLLGTGGLVRAYSKATQAGLKNSTIILKQHGHLLEMTTDYHGVGKIQYLLGQRGLAITHSEYAASVCLEILVPLAQLMEVKETLTEATNGLITYNKCNEVYFSMIDGMPHIFTKKEFR